MLSQSEKEDLWHRGKYERILEHDLPFVRSYVSKHAYDYYEKEDLFQECMMSCTKYIGHWRPNTCTFTTHFKHACRFALLAYYGRANRQRRNDGLYGEALEDAKPTPAYKRGSKHLVAAMASIRPVERDCFIAVHACGAYRKHGNGERLAVVSEKYGLAPRSAYEIARVAKKYLREYMREHGA